MPDEPRVVALMREFKRELLRREETAMRALALRWVQLEEALAPEMQALADEIAARRAAGEPVSEMQVFRLEQYLTLQRQLQAETRRYNDDAAALMTAEQRELARLGIEQATTAIVETMAEGGIRLSFLRLPVEAIEAMVGLAGNGSPLREVLERRVFAGALEGAVKTLIQATAEGWNPRKTARLLRDGFTGGLNPALRVARTEQLRVFREAGRQQYVVSGVVTGQRRLAAHDGRVCAACLADEGRIYPLDAVIPDHPQGRCTGVPVVRGMPEVQWPAGEAWLREQPERVQRSVLGAAFEGWQSGEFGMGALVEHTMSEEWGAGIRVRREPSE